MNGADQNSGKFSCLIVEDDAAFGTMCAQVVREEGGDPVLAATFADAHEAAADREFDLTLLDNHLPDGMGYELFDQLSRRNPEAPVVMITGVPDLGDAVRLTRNGLFDYLTKPLTVEGLAGCLRRAKLRMQARTAMTIQTDWFADSPSMKDLARQLQQAARHPASTVLFTGETGTGKDLAARLLHQMTYPIGAAPFIAVNCAALPGEMFESELFGAERGAYTGADKRRSGLVGAATGGTLFLDEIAEVPVRMQAKLLRLLEGKEYRSLGSTEGQSFSGRFVAATNRNLKEETNAGRFREDLLYRLDVFTVELPPLRQRRADIAGLAEFLLSQLAQKYNRPKPLFRAESLAALSSHDFPGNVRELRNVLERSLLKTADESRWLALDMNRTLAAGPNEPTPTPAGPAQTPATERNLNAIEAQEYRLIREALDQTNGGIRRAATVLGMSPQALLCRLEKWPELRGTKV